jgi:hypothetical protein
MGIRLAGGNKYGLFICEIQLNSVAHKAGLFVADKIFSVSIRPHLYCRTSHWPVEELV